MPRTITTPPDFSGAALAALKEWLAIATAREDALLLRLLASAHETCERFTGLIPLACGVEEVLDPGAGWLSLATRPVRALTSVTWLDADGEATVIETAAWSRAIAADGSGGIRLDDPPKEGRLVVSFTAGIAGNWAAIPPALGDGILRLAAHAYRGRDNAQGSGASEPPAAVAALWRAWRRLRL
jgi:uncharacterized phiE125 gp8 family phage protein